MNQDRCSIHGVRKYWKYNHYSGRDRKVCPVCEQEDEEQKDEEDTIINDVEVQVEDCDRCSGSGFEKTGDDCIKCHGDGEVKIVKEVK